MARNKHPEVTINRILDVSFKLFMEKGYEHTTIQDIVDELGDLSKGAIYHHFKSKEEIIEAVSERLYAETDQKILALRHRQNLNGLEKIQEMFRIALDNPNQEVFLTAAPNFLKNPKFLAQQLHTSVEEAAPIIRLLIEEGIQDGSISTDYPQEAAEVLLLLSNIWLNPLIFSVTAEALKRRFLFLKDLTAKMGIPVLDDAILQKIDWYRATFSDDTPAES